MTITQQALAKIQPPRGAPASAWAMRISACWQASVKAILEVGRLLSEAKAALPHGAFGTMCESELPFSSSTAQRLMAIAADPKITNPAHVQYLPPSWGTLYEITKLTDEQFEKGIAEKTIRPDMERREVINGARSIMGSRQEPDDSLDYFPTPPWATRALIEIVLPRIGVGQLGSVWEPACGEGHIAEVLSEYCQRVLATDIFDYGYGNVQDFGEIRLQPSGDDWIITNPPFGENAIWFVRRALAMASVGVAMFFRSQWAVEGVERYEEIFRDKPPTWFCPFVERVNLCKGRWEPDGSTATAYCWLVWLKNEPCGLDLLRATRVLWIPPTCRKELTHPDDAERFTAHPVIRSPMTDDSISKHSLTRSP